jgi:hypothetical protein
VWVCKILVVKGLCVDSFRVGTILSMGSLSYTSTGDFSTFRIIKGEHMVETILSGAAAGGT